MANTLKALVAVSILAILAACAERGSPAPDVAVAIPAPVTMEPVFTGKYN